MQPLISSWQKTKWYKSTNAAAWAAYRTALLGSIYPSGLPDTLADVVTVNYTCPWVGYAKPPECATVTRYTMNTPGGRSGGTAMYAWLLNPVTPAAGPIVLTFAGGHLTPGTLAFDNYYCVDLASSVIRQALAAGWYVVYVGMVGFDQEPSPWTAVVNGSLATAPSDLPHNGTFFAPMLSDGGPSPMRYFTDPVIVTTNQAVHDLAPTRLFLAGHSGGGYITTLVQCLDARFRASAALQGGAPFNSAPAFVPGTGDYEQDYVNNAIFSLLPTKDYGGMALAAACQSGARCFVGAGAADVDFEVSNRAALVDWYSLVGDCAATQGNPFQFCLEPVVNGYDTHVINPVEASAVMAWFQRFVS